MRPALYYAAFVCSAFGSMRALCTKLNCVEADFATYIEHARFHQSDIVIVDNRCLGDPESNVLMGLKFSPNGSVKLLACYFGEASEDEADVRSFIDEMTKVPEFAKRECYLGTFRPVLSREFMQ
jgi:hypothetical protein